MPRYAIYYMPVPGSRLHTFGRHAIGYDADRGEPCSFHDHPLYARPDVHAWTESPRRYGFHATLKAPFELAGDATVEDLLEAVGAFAARLTRIAASRLRVARIGSFMALKVAGAGAAIDDLAANCVREFERFRAPLSAADLARRLEARLSARQHDHLVNWGYPYVFEEFRFHMTLTGHLTDEALAAEAEAALTELYHQADEPVAISAITVVEQAERTGGFRVVRRFSLPAA